jgi:hypothetical protein
MKTLLLLLLCGSACAQDYDFQVYNEGIGAQGALSGTFEYLSGMITLSLDGETYSTAFQGVQSLALAAPDGNYLTTRFVGSLGDPTVLLGDITWHLPQGGDWTYCGGSPDCNSAIVMTARTQSFAAQAPEIDSKGWAAGLTLLIGGLLVIRGKRALQTQEG